MKAYEIPAKRFVEVASPEFLKELDTHSKNFTHFNQEGNKDLENKAFIQGKRVVSQLEAALREIEDVRESLEPDDERLFFQKITPTKDKVLTAIQKFNNLAKSSTSLHLYSEQQQNNALKDNIGKLQILAEEKILEDRSAQLEAIEGLQKDIVELNELFVEFSKHVEVIPFTTWITCVFTLALYKSQGETVNAVESNVESAAEHVEEGVKQLEKAAKLKTAFYPITGALLGTCIGGPIGLVAGLKIGALTALGGTVLGFSGGRLLKKSQEEATSDSARLKSHSISANLNSSQRTALTHSATSGVISQSETTSSHLHKD